MKHIRLFSTKAECKATELVKPNLCLVKESNNIYTNLENDYVDLGLESGTLWMRCNIGAENETDFGLYFQFGDIVGHTGDEALSHSSWSTCPGNGGNSSVNTSLLSAWNNTNTTNNTLNTLADAAYIHTNGDAKMPTQDQMTELINGTTHVWTTINGINGAKFTNKADSSKYIFFPASGFIADGILKGVGEAGDVWSGSVSSSDFSKAYRFAYTMKNWYNCAPDTRSYGFCVRGVLA